ncbi:MAG: bifunctional nuclease family protein [Acidobacteriota bacterium]|nr:bifunctional nuclease family protein [Acidobacteriota bacterium]MDH3524932.1 bifunctional nuclease family protein [Acidobacteriota bacterium]
MAADSSDEPVVDEPVVDEPVAMRIKGLMLDPSSNTPIVILRDEAERLFLPIWIGVFEANAIAMELEDARVPRPMTHDLFHNTLAAVQVTLERVVIRDLQDNTFFAVLRLSSGGKAFEIDARPSDALALALRAGAPIFVLSSVLAKAEAIDLVQRIQDEDELKRWLADVDPDELGKYPM